MGPKNKKGASKKTGKDSYLADDQNFQSFSNQLLKLGLELRDITGDGNCCFRALSDQMEGSERLHLEFRNRVCMYMRQNRDEFEPFVAALIEEEEADINKKMNKKLDAFEKYIKNLENTGTYADNGCLVAFARLYQVDINIHQLDLPVWTIHGCIPRKNQVVRQLHLSYHNGEHYSSIRPLGDRTNTPTNISFASSLPPQPPVKKVSKANSNNYYNDSYDNYASDTEDAQNLCLQNLKVDQIMTVTDCHDVNLIVEKLKENDDDLEKTIMALTEMRLEGEDESSGEESGTKSKSGKKDSKKNKRDKKVEKKQRQMERQRIEVLKQREQEAPNAKPTSKCIKTNDSNRQDNLLQDNEPDLNISINNVQVNSI